jgi:hypothetical protein
MIRLKSDLGRTTDFGGAGNQSFLIVLHAWLPGPFIFVVLGLLLLFSRVRAGKFQKS